MKIVQFFLLIFAGSGFLLLHSQQPAQAGWPGGESPLPEIDAYIEAQMRELDIPGLAVAIVRGDDIVVRGYGTADNGGRPVTAQTPFLIASFSKSFTALGILQLVEAGKLQLDDPVQKYLPWFQVADPDHTAQISIRRLLHHTSGFSEIEGYVKNLDRDGSDQALEAGVRRLARSHLNAAPGERFEYSNTNYDILGLIIQTVTGKSYEDYVEEHIFAPLNMQHSHTSLEAARRGGLSSGYTAFFGSTILYDRWMPYARTVTPSTGLFSSAEDMAQYLYAHLHQGRGPDGTVLLSPAGMAELHKPGIQISKNAAYAMGWTVFPFAEAAAADGPVPTGISHGGEWANYKAIMVLIPERKLGVAVLMNKNQITEDAAYDNICWNTALLALGLEPALVPQQADFLARHGRGIGVSIVLLLASSAVLSALMLLRHTPENHAVRSQRRSVIFFSVLLLIDLALAGYLWFVQIPQSGTTLPLALSFEPDIGLIYLLILAFTLGWGSLRTVLAVNRLKKTQANSGSG